MEQIDDNLNRWFGHESFRPGQREAIEAVLAGRDAVVVMPTGSGKSLCYQLAAMSLPGVTLVVSPLIALMKDQVDGLTRKGLPATFINSTLSTEEISKRLANMVRGAYKLVYVAPERFRAEGFAEALARTPLSLLTVDEAHCISQWGHDFRPDYLEIRKVLAHLPPVRVMAVTATATPDVRKDIRNQLGLGLSGRGEPFVEVLGFARPNLHITVKHVRSALAKLAPASETIRAHKAGIVYVATRRHAAEVHEKLQQELAGYDGIDLLLYHGALTDVERAAVQDRFMRARCPVVVATNAFGMGVDRPDLRFVIHWDMPGGIEAYYQEIGRAGRDGLPAECLLLYNPFDVRIQEFFNAGANPDWRTAATILRELEARGKGLPLRIDTDDLGRRLGIDNGIAVDTVLNVLQANSVLIRTNERRGRESVITLNTVYDRNRLAAVFAARRTKAQRDDARLEAMVRFCSGWQCRHAYILNYFEERSPQTSCGGCDICDARRDADTTSTSPERGSATETSPERGPATESALQGEWGENVAARYLEGCGWKVLARNVRPCANDRRCEIDLIARDLAGGVVFVEVKTHKTRSPYAPRLAAVDRRKKHVLLRACSNWILTARWHGNFRFDVVEVYGSHEHAQASEIDHIRNVPLFPPKWRFW